MISKRQKTISLLATIIILSVSQAEAAREGVPGPAGQRGLKGAQWKPGPKGDTGATGAAGPAGAAGVVGPAGARPSLVGRHVNSMPIYGKGFLAI